MLRTTEGDRIGRNGCGRRVRAATRLNAGVVILLLVVGATACSGKEQEYPRDVAADFIAACDSQPGATRQECECALHELSKKYAFSRFMEEDAAAASGSSVGPEVLRAVETCGK
jgi:hypothetical protein